MRQVRREGGVAACEAVCAIIRGLNCSCNRNVLPSAGAGERYRENHPLLLPDDRKGKVGQMQQALSRLFHRSPAMCRRSYAYVLGRACAVRQQGLSTFRRRVMGAIVFNDMSAEEVADLLVAMPPETRLRFLEVLSERFCLSCGLLH